MSAKDYNDSMGQSQSRKEFDESINQARQTKVMKGHVEDSRFDNDTKGNKESDEVKVVRPHEHARSKYQPLAKEHINTGFRGVK